MRLIDADEVRRRLSVPLAYCGRGSAEERKVQWAHEVLDNAPTVDVPQPLTRDGVLAAVKAIKDAGDTAVVEVQPADSGEWCKWNLGWVSRWPNPDVPRWNVRVRAVEVETEDVPLTQLVGRTIKGCKKPVFCPPFFHAAGWHWQAGNDGGYLHDFPDGTLDLATGLVTVVKGEA